MSNANDSVERLKAKYQHSFGSLYLTYIPLNDMTVLLNEKKKFADLAKKPPFGAILQEFKGFLNTYRNTQLNQALAFVQLELGTGKAGWKKISDRDGVIIPMPWLPEQVWGIAEFCDAFLSNLLEFEQKKSVIASGALSIAQAWKDRKDLKKDPYIPTLRTAELDRDFRSMIKNKLEELEALKAQNRPLYAAIQEFSTSYDRFVAALSRKKALEPLRLKSVELCDAMEKVTTGYEDYLATLQRKKVLDILKSSTRSVFKDLGYLSAAEETLDENFIEIYQNLAGEALVPGILTAQPLRQLLIGSGKRSEADYGQIIWPNICMTFACQVKTSPSDRNLKSSIIPSF